MINFNVEVVADMAKAKQTIRIMMADDHVIFRQGVRKLLEGEDDIDIVGEAANGDECIAMVAKLRPAIVLLDLNMPGKIGLAVLEEVNFDSLSTRAIILTAAEDERDAVRAMCPRDRSEAIGERSASQEHPPGLQRRNLAGQSRYGRGHEGLCQKF